MFMGNKKRLMIRYLRRFLFFFLLSLLIFFTFIGDISEILPKASWPLIIITSIIIGIAVSTFYKHSIVEEVVGDFKYLKRDIEESRFKIIEHRNNSFLLKPKFDYPYSLFNGELIEVEYSDQVAIIKGAKYYVETLIKDINGDANRIVRLLSKISISLLIIAMGILPLVPDSGIDRSLKQWFHNLKMQVMPVDIIEATDAEALGNTMGNTNNNGYGVETEHYIFYIEDHLNLIKTDKGFSERLALNNNKDKGGFGIIRLITF